MMKALEKLRAKSMKRKVGRKKKKKNKKMMIMKISRMLMKSIQGKRMYK